MLKNISAENGIKPRATVRPMFIQYLIYTSLLLKIKQKTISCTSPQILYTNTLYVTNILSNFYYIDAYRNSVTSMEYVVIFSNKWTSSFSITYFGTSNVVVWLCSILGDEEFPGIPPRICSISSVYATSSHAINQIVGKTKYKNQRQFIVLK